jgi:uncharacterized membrane protein
VSVFLFLLVPSRKFGGKTRYVLSFAAIIAACIVIGGITVHLTWTRHLRWPPTSIPTIDLSRHLVDVANASPRQQLASILAQPLAFLKLLVMTIYELKRGYLVGFVGRLGWLDTRIPVWVPYAYAVVLVVVSSLKDAPARVGWKAKGLSVGIFGVMLLGGHVQLYLLVNTMAFFQGRYLIPIAPLLLLVFHNQASRRRLTNAGAIALIAFVTLTLSLTSYRVVERFYLVAAPAAALAEPTARQGVPRSP